MSPVRLANICPLLVALFLFSVVAIGCDAQASRPARATTGHCTAPVEAAISDPFRPPIERWDPGNRGLTFATVPRQPVRAVKRGTVEFAGKIASDFYVTVSLGDGRDTTYSYLSSVAVAEGDQIDRGAVIGETGDREFQLGLRRDGDYLDPTGLVEAACGRQHAILVPVPK